MFAPPISTSRQLVPLQATVSLDTAPRASRRAFERLWAGWATHALGHGFLQWASVTFFRQWLWFRQMQDSPQRSAPMALAGSVGSTAKDRINQALRGRIALQSGFHCLACVSIHHSNGPHSACSLPCASQLRPPHRVGNGRGGLAFSCGQLRARAS